MFKFCINRVNNVCFHSIVKVLPFCRCEMKITSIRTSVQFPPPPYPPFLHYPILNLDPVGNTMDFRCCGSCFEGSETQFIECQTRQGFKPKSQSSKKCRKSARLKKIRIKYSFFAPLHALRFSPEYYIILAISDQSYCVLMICKHGLLGKLKQP